MKRYNKNYKSLVIGATGSIGAAFVKDLEGDDQCEKVVQLSRSEPNEFGLTIDLKDESSIAFAAMTLQLEGPFDLVLVSNLISYDKFYLLDIY
jgi:FlaA1/EpsC-like NDP-sugar epimerase